MATFHPFPRLPLELRIQIWELAFTSDRVLKVRRKRYPDREYWSPAQIPAVTRTCRESRRHCSYQKAFTIDGFPQYIWVHFTGDIIQMSSWIIPELVKRDSQEMHRISHLRLELMYNSQPDDPEWFFHQHSHQIREFLRLQSCDVLVNDGLYNWGTFIKETYWGVCPIENVRMIDAKTGEYIDAKTSRGYLDYFDTGGGKNKEFAREPDYFVEEWEEEEEYAERWAEMMEIGTNPLPRIDLNY